MVKYLEFYKMDLTYTFKKTMVSDWQKASSLLPITFFVHIQTIKDILERYICGICNSMICIFVEFAKINFDIKQNYFKIK
jgi:hypothetical protein